jgi:tRNA (mo5U34)-methyltransferase
MSGLAEIVASEEPWYHTFELPGGVVTDGFFDLRPVAEKIPMPKSLAGMRCLDAAACEGFWSFEMRKRGASEVVSVDLPDTTEQDWQGSPGEETLEAGSGVANRHFRIVRDALAETEVERVDMNLYDLSAEAIGTFDYVFVGNILIHLADPARALRAIGSVMKPDAQLLSLEPNSLALSALSPWLATGQLWDWDDQARWWTPNRAGHRRIVEAAGFKVERQGGILFQPFGLGTPKWPARRPRGLRELIYWSTVRRIGVSSGWVSAVSR